MDAMADECNGGRLGWERWRLAVTTPAAATVTAVVAVEMASFISFNMPCNGMACIQSYIIHNVHLSVAGERFEIEKHRFIHHIEKGTVVPNSTLSLFFNVLFDLGYFTWHHKHRSNIDRFYFGTHYVNFICVSI